MIIKKNIPTVIFGLCLFASFISIVIWDLNFYILFTASCVIFYIALVTINKPNETFRPYKKILIMSISIILASWFVWAYHHQDIEYSINQRIPEIKSAVGEKYPQYADWEKSSQNNIKWTYELKPGDYNYSIFMTYISYSTDPETLNARCFKYNLNTRTLDHEGTYSSSTNAIYIDPITCKGYE